MRNRILHLADLHLGAPVTHSVRELYPSISSKLAESRDSLPTRLANWIESSLSQVGLVVIAGDLFHSHAPDESVVSQTKQAIAKMAAVVPVITVPGNHDEYSYPDCVYRKGSWPGRLVTETEPTRVWQGELEHGVPVAVTSIAYEAGRLPPGSAVRFPANETGTIGVALVHGTVSDYFQGALLDGERCFTVSHDQVAAAGYHYLALGHIHASDRWERGQCLAVYPGPPVGTSPSRPGSGSLTLVEVATGGVKTHAANEPELIGVQWHPVAIDVAPEEPISETLERLETMLPEADHLIPTIELTGSVEEEDFGERLQQFLLEKGTVAIVESENVRVAPPIDLATLLEEQSLAGEFTRCWQEWCDHEPPTDVDRDLVLREGLAALKHSK